MRIGGYNRLDGLRPLLSDGGLLLLLLLLLIVSDGREGVTRDGGTVRRRGRSSLGWRARDYSR